MAREMVARRSHFTVTAAVVILTVAIGLYAAQRTGLLQARLPVQEQAQPQTTPASQSPAVSVSVSPVLDRVTIEGVADSKEPVISSNPREPAGADVAQATRSQSTHAGAGPLRFAAG